MELLGTSGGSTPLFTACRGPPDPGVGCFGCMQPKPGPKDSLPSVAASGACYRGNQWTLAACSPLSTLRSQTLRLSASSLTRTFSPSNSIT